MRDSTTVHLAIILITITVILFLIAVRVSSLEDKVWMLEQKQLVKEIVSRGHGTGIGIGGSSRTFIDEEVDTNMSISHYFKPVNKGMGMGTVSTTGKVDTIGGGIGKGNTSVYYHTFDPMRN